METFQARIQRANKENGHVCVGVDPRPEHLRNSESAIEWCQDLVNATAPYAAAFKPNLAFFLQLKNGLEALEATANTAHKHDKLVILDAKFADIGSTASAYATFASDIVNADIVTLNPYLGTDVLEPFHQAGLDAFVLARTTNPSASQVQDATYGSVVQRFRKHGTGFVAPGNRPQQVRSIRETAGPAPLLLPGIGAQGGSITQAAKAADGGPFFITASRSIAQAEGTFPEASANKTRSYRQSLEDALATA